ncbi:hypothetical protein [Halovivax cerinus]|uniref:Uncharacterized protein n=1 Tax=Halovivax cerinus TaxID=1487865 RepID=A0ABD5NTG1_9EURY|nr:hypothetical protein [Halovivax cerinus]
MHETPASAPVGATAEPPDVGWLAAVGLYVGVVLSAASVAVAAAAGVSAATIVGTLSTLFTFGLVAGALGAKGTPGLAERIGHGLPWLAVPFLAPVGFAAATVVVLETGVPDVAAIGTGLGTLLAGSVGGALVGMARTRYARAMVSGDALATIDWVRTNQATVTAGWGVGLLVLAGVPVLFQDGPIRTRFSPHLLLMGTMFILMAWSSHARLTPNGDKSTEEGRLRRFLPDRARRSVFGQELRYDQEIDPWVTLNEIEFHPEGLVLSKPMQRRFVPWTAITGVTLTDDELRLERDGWLDVRCHRDVIDDPTAVVETIERLRSSRNLADRRRGMETVA